MTYAKSGKGHYRDSSSAKCPCAVPADRLEELAFRVQRLMISHRDPERFFVERSDIADEMRRLARAVR